MVTVYDAGQDDGRLWIAMRWVEGGEDLGDRIDAVGGPLDLATTLDVLDQIGGALDAAHALGLVHRDVKPSNILLEGDRAFLTDFGVIRRVEGGNDLTRSEEFMGHDRVGRARAHRRRRAGAGHRRLLARLRCSTRAWPRASRTKARARARCSWPTSRSRRPSCRTSGCSRCSTAPWPRTRPRFQTAGELSAAARAAAVGEAVQAASAHAPRAAAAVPVTARHRRWPWVAAGAAALVAIVVVVVLLVSGGGGDSGTSAQAYEDQVRASDTTLTREVREVAARDAQGGSLDVRVERNIQVRDAVRRAAGRLAALAPPAKVARDHAVLVDSYRLLVEECDDAIRAAQHGDAAALARVDRRLANGQSASAQQVHRASARIEAALT